MRNLFPLSLKGTFAVCIATATMPCFAQTVVVATPPDQATATVPGVMNRTTVVLDAAHGGADKGARIGDSIHEADITLALALKLQSVLTARGLTVVMTRASDAADKPNATGTAMTLDDRAGIANHARGSACLLLHATSSGTGVHLFATDLDGVSNEATILPWATAQAAWVLESVQLERRLAQSLRQSNVDHIASKASIRPVDSLTCPAVVVELAPDDEDVSSVADGGYQQRVAESIASALEAWSKQVQPPNRLLPPPRPKAALKAVDPSAPAVPSTTAPGVQP